ncbi:ShlB/FhaC/HecB family hemolysin secretion/activation protein [Rhodoferax sp. PAMC 29310]|uniref:ShlB/FhaC/HecB family hemolysin secretion/activation protein n=1 Tax=Rhodoferax sp. PAMC 29310 TaxID=2822760 RepID=UPI001B325FF3|nr:ShlB/FhaC/HecB family hemolysin secretion/activation protein [Rhodoferax sp. PAMC 29310]
MKICKLNHFVALALLGWVAQASAQGSTGLQGATPPQPPPTDASVVPKIPPAPSVAQPLGGASVELQSVRVAGNTALSTEALLGALGDVKGQRFDMAGLNALVAKLEALYRSEGYSFTQVYLPAQDMKDGVLQVTVLEGRYGVIRTAGKDNLPEGAQPFLNYGFKQGDLIRNKALERTLLILDDQPGLKIHPVIKPGAAQGEADLTVNVERVSSTSGEVGFDNTGARSTGAYRLHGLLDINSPFRYGDKISLNGMLTNEQMWLGSIDYSVPIGASGLRGQIGHAHTSYQLGGQFSVLDAVGIANVTTAKLSYPLVRSQATNVLLSLGFQHKDLQDDYRAAGVVRNKSSNGVPVSLQFDKRDALLGGGVTYGSLNWLAGKLTLDEALTVHDLAQTLGSFNKINIDVARIQNVAGNLSFYARYSGQWASKNLDSSEKFNLGGYYGVRAYPLGEGVGDKGWFTQLEMRYIMGAVTPFLFYDSGQSNANAQPWGANANATRTVSGPGIGVRSFYGAWSLDATLAWRGKGGPSTSDGEDRNPRLYFMLGRRF